MLRILVTLQAVCSMIITNATKVAILLTYVHWSQRPLEIPYKCDWLILLVINGFTNITHLQNNINFEEQKYHLKVGPSKCLFKSSWFIYALLKIQLCFTVLHACSCTFKFYNVFCYRIIQCKWMCCIFWNTYVKCTTGYMGSMSHECT